MRVLIVLAAIAAAVAAAPRNQQRIVGGSLTTINSYPDIVALLVQTGTVFTQECGGAIINNRAFLSAAHCFYNSAPFFWRGRVGSTYANSGGFVYAVSRIVIHPYYNTYTEDSDIAVLLTSAAISFSGSVAPASIAGPNYNLFDNQVVWGAGWGVTFFGGVKSEQLRHVQIWTVNQRICWERYASVGSTITDNMLCSGWLDVGGRDMCTGDSGGPLYHNRNVVGISSFGVSCANPRYPGVNARVSRFALWIRAVAESA